MLHKNWIFNIHEFTSNPFSTGRTKPLLYSDLAHWDGNLQQKENWLYPPCKLVIIVRMYAKKQEKWIFELIFVTAQNKENV